MQKVVFPNGLKVIFEHKKSNSIVVEVMVRVGSDNEKVDERGISHFIEHLLFEGTSKRPNNKELSNEIERVGGDFNAYTSNERTCFYVKVLKKHFSLAVEVLADILRNSLFNEKDINKERNIIIKEIDMVNDEPRYYQWILLQQTLFEKHPCRYPTYGTKEVIKEVSREKILDYFERYYVPNNMVISVVGDVKNWKKEIEKWFLFGSKKSVPKLVIKEPATSKLKVKKEKRKIVNTYSVMGFKTIPKTHADTYPLEIINGILGRGQSGRMFTEIRGKRGLAYDVGTQNVAEATYGYFAVYASIDKKNIEMVRDLMLKEISKLKDINEQDLKESKDYIEGDYLLEVEDNQKVADQLLFWEDARRAELMREYVKNIRKVKIKDVMRVLDKYFKKYTFAVLEGK